MIVICILHCAVFLCVHASCVGFMICSAFLSCFTLIIALLTNVGGSFGIYWFCVTVGE